MFLIVDTMGLVIWEWKKFYKLSKLINYLILSVLTIRIKYKVIFL